MPVPRNPGYVSIVFSDVFIFMPRNSGYVSIVFSDVFLNLFFAHEIVRLFSMCVNVYMFIFF